ncbi:DUF349 domain-containing protein [Marinobacter sp. AN1]|uniref:DUF349 domain-containing protein n=1 Tax=Marinobacter sp. AN1 TaxID=2886046 RepID=UPI00222FEAAE|nr:DUF349 domain-containing protein [Marinobacter sp. AN1]UZD67354.1 DUF349 domain-containing protein [Marinobacter sp. AN1]
MAAFIQRLFQKRFTSATSQDNRSGTRPEANNPPGKELPGVDQDTIDRQRTLLSQPDCSQQTLAELAIEGLAADVRLEAARRLTDTEHLQQVQKLARGKDKGVYQQVRQSLQELRRQQEETRATNEAVAAIVRQAEELAATRDTNLYEARVQKLEQRWQSLEHAADNETRSVVLSALHNCRLRVREMEQERQARAEHQAKQVQRQQTLTLLQDTLEAFEAEPPAVNALPSLDALQRTQENRWLEATRETDVARQEQKDYEQRMVALRGVISALGRLSHHQDELDQLTKAESPEPARARQLLAQLDWPGAVALPEALQVLARTASVRTPQPTSQADPEAQRQQLEQLDKAVADLEEALEARQLKESRQLLKRVQSLQRQLPEREGTRYRARLQRLGGQVRELGDWQGFATTPKQTALCEQMEYLAEQPMEPEAKAERIQELQQEWRDLGGSSDRDLWQRFRAASDRAFEPCRAYFEARSDLKKVHLQKRRSICDELERYLEATDWSEVDWKAAEQIEKTARQEWREAWPVEFRDNRTIQKAFDRLMNTLSGHLDEERSRNEDRKQAIVDQARELVDHTPLTEAMDKAKELQQQWQAIGITRHREDRKLWKAFRAACDAIFARREEQRQQKAQASTEADAAAESDLAKARHWLDTAGAEQADAGEILEALKVASETPVSGNLKQSLRATRTQVQERLDQLGRQAQMRQWQQWVHQRQAGELTPTQLPAHWPDLSDETDLHDPRELVVLAEIHGGHSSPEEDQSLRMALQVRRLKQGFEQAQGDQAINLEALAARWCVALDRESLTPELSDRLQRAMELT